MYHPEFVMFFDNHTQKACPDVGQNFDVEIFADKLQSVGVDLVGFHAKCNQGFCYYDTHIGIRHPALKPGRDLFGEVVDSCSRRGIKVTAYLNCGLSYETAMEHPEWCQIGPDGSFLHPEIEGTHITPYMRLMCLNSPWREQLKQMIAEVYAKYPVAGFLLDSFNAFPCICKHCVEGMWKAGLDPLKQEDVRKFAYMSALRLCEEIAEMLQPKKKGLFFNCLGLSPRDNARLGTYLECECIPTVPVWGYDWLPIYSRYLRTLTDGPILNMTGRFYDWGDFGTLRTDAALEYDLFFGLSNGMRPNVGDHIHPRGDLHEGIFEAVKRIYAKVRRYDPWYAEAVNPVDAAVVFPEGDSKAALTGAVRMLSELKSQFEVVDFQNNWSRYPLLILPDNILLDKTLQEKIRKYLCNGGKILATGVSGLDRTESRFPFAEEWGAEYLGPSRIHPPYFRMEGKFASIVSNLPQAVNAGGIEVKALHPSDVAGRIVKPYYNKHWEGLYSYYYTPPDQLTDLPFLLLNERTAYCPWRLFEGYYQAATPDLRHVFRLMLEHLLARPLLKTDSSLPSFARAIVSENRDARMVHLFNYLPELRGKMLIVEDSFITPQVRVGLRTDGRTVSQVYMAPDQVSVPFTINAGYVEFTVPEVRGYALAVAEFQKI